MPPPLPPPERPILLAGPTASGKSALALQIARAQGRAVVNADALQVHDTWSVLTARPQAGDLAQAPHLLYGHIAPDEGYSVGHWLREVAAHLHLLPAPVIVGGTGLYLSALTEGLAEIPATPPEVRARADATLADGGIAALLAALDPETIARIDTRNPARVQRAWEVLETTGRGLAAWQARTGPPLLPAEGAECWLLMPDREVLGARIATRFDAMLREGALDEARAALPRWPGNAGTATAPLWTRAIGAAELIAHLQGHISLDDARTAATLATQRYAKRQRTWFSNRMRGWRLLETG